MSLNKRNWCEKAELGLINNINACMYIYSRWAVNAKTITVYHSQTHSHWLSRTQPHGDRWIWIVARAKVSWLTLWQCHIQCALDGNLHLRFVYENIAAPHSVQASRMHIRCSIVCAVCWLFMYTSNRVGCLCGMEHHNSLCKRSSMRTRRTLRVHHHCRHNPTLIYSSYSC